MNSIKITLPKKLSRVEILSSKELSNEDYFQYIPLTQVPVENYSPDTFNEEIANLRNIDYEKDIFEMLDIPIQQTFYREVSFTDQRRPIQISLDKLPKETILLSDAKRKIQESYDMGFREGQEITEDHLKEEISRHQSWIKIFDNLSIDLRKQYSNEISKLEESIVGLSIEIAKHILNNELKSDTNIFTTQIKKALSEIDNETIFKIHINPKNFAVLETIKSELLLGYDADKVVIEPNKNVDLLGCILETSTGKIDATIDSQLKKITNKLSSLPIETDPDEDIKESTKENIKLDNLE